MATRVTLWGAGAGATAYAMACRTLGWTIDSVGSRSTGRARVLAEQVDAADAFGFDAATPAIGGLTIVVTPPADHPTAVDRVGDVVVVAPLAMTLAAADQMVDLGASMLRVFGWPLVSAPTTQELMRRAGGIGTPTSLAMSASRPLPDWGGYATDRWGGGALVFVGHDLVALTLLLSRFVGLGPPVAVAATMSSDGDGPDRSVAVRLMFADGFVATVDAAWSNGGSPRADAQLSGTDGVLRIDSDPAPSLEHDGETVPLARPALADERTRPLHDAGLIDMVKTIGALRTSGRALPHAFTFAFGREVLDVIAAASWSAGLDGTPVPLPFTGARDLTSIDLFRTAAAL